MTEVQYSQNTNAAISEHEQLRALQKRMEECADIQFEPPVEHVFIGGIYSRTIFIPAGALIAGRIHKYEHLSNISCGLVDVIEENVLTGEICRCSYQAPCQFSSSAGTKRMVYAHQDTVWTTYHNHNGHPSPEGIEDVFTWRDIDAFNAEKIEVQS